MKPIIINKNSWHTKAYKFMYGASKYSKYNSEWISNIPDNVCPYFWKTILAVIMSAICILYTFPIILIIYIINGRKPLQDKELWSTMGIGTCLYVSIAAALFILYCEFIFIVSLIYPILLNSKDMFGPFASACLMNFLAIICLVRYGILQYREYLKNKRREKTFQNQQGEPEVEQKKDNKFFYNH